MSGNEGNTDNMTTELDEEKLQDIYAWVDSIKLSRPKKNITRDFSDGVLIAEVIHHYLPRLVELHNYTPANSTQQKMSNWGTLNRKVLSKINYSIPEGVLRSICNCKPGVIEVILWQVRQKVDNAMSKRYGSKMSPDGYFDGHEVGALSDRSDRHDKKFLVSPGKPPKHAAPAPKAPIVHMNNGRRKKKESNLTKTRSLTHLNDLPSEARIIIEEKEQALLASQEMIQILQAKVRRLEHLLHLKEIRIEELTKRSGGPQ